jgi:hypothetical protein
MQKGILFILAFCVVISSHAQRYIWSPDSLASQDPNYGMDRYQDILRYHDPVMYLAFPVIRPVRDRPVALQEGEGKDGYWLESHFGYRFTVYKGKYYSSSILQRMRFTLDANLTGRLTRDDSNPLLPFNNKVGLGLDYLFSPLNRLQQQRINVIWMTAQLHHYSNGMADSFFIEGPIRRNNYRSGDFSTNYWKLMLNYAGSSRDRSMVIANIGFQRDISLSGPLASSAELKRYYGNSRLLLSFQWAQKPQLRAMHYTDYSTPERVKIAVERRKQIAFRTELEYILGNLDNFPGENKYRTGWHNYLTYAPSVTNEVGFMAHTFLGRDYLNMRFDDIVFVGELGVSLKFASR